MSRFAVNIARMARQWDELGAGLEDRARQIRAQLGIDETLTRIGRPTLTGSPALRVMVAHDIDLTVAVTELDSRSVAAVAGLGAKLATRPDVRVVTFRKDIGHWNTDPGYPDGLYLFVECIVCLANRGGGSSRRARNPGGGGLPVSCGSRKRARSRTGHGVVLPISQRRQEGGRSLPGADTAHETSWCL